MNKIRSASVSTVKIRTKRVTSLVNKSKRKFSIGDISLMNLSTLNVILYKTIIQLMPNSMNKIVSFIRAKENEFH